MLSANVCATVYMLSPRKEFPSFEAMWRIQDTRIYIDIQANTVTVPGNHLFPVSDVATEGMSAVSLE